MKTYHYRRKYSHNKQSGYVLITGLIFILVITLVTTSTMESSNLNYKVSSNSVFKDIAFQGSESGRTASGEAISYYVYHREWEGIETPDLDYEADYDPSTDQAQTGEDLFSTSTLGIDMNFDVSGDAIETINADISVIKAPGVRSEGSGMQQLSGYEGLGKGAAAGGFHLIYELRSSGYGPDSAVAVTASELRIVP